MLSFREASTIVMLSALVSKEIGTCVVFESPNLHRQSVSFPVGTTLWNFDLLSSIYTEVLRTLSGWNIVGIVWEFDDAVPVRA